MTLALAAPGIALAASDTLLLTDDFGNAIRDASVTVMSLDPALASGVGASGGAGFAAHALRAGGYAMPEGLSGPAMIRVEHPILGTLESKVDLTGSSTLELVASGLPGALSLREAGMAAPSAGRTRSDARLRTGGGTSSVGGDTCALAAVIDWADITAAGGYTDTGTTGTTDSSPVECGIFAGGSDVFYEFEAGETECVALTTCLAGSPGDTVLQVWNDPACTDAGPCNDDSCTVPPGGHIFNSTLPNVPVDMGTTYTVQIDHWASSAPLAYEFNASIGSGPCTVECPPDGIPEGETDCDPFTDDVNGGCNFPPPWNFTDVNCGDTICAEYYASSNWRDPDWFEFTVDEPTEVEWCGIGEAPTLIGLINDGPDPDDCPPAPAFTSFALLPAFSGGCVTELKLPGTWMAWGGPSVFAGVPCNTPYTLALNCEGLCGDEPPSGEGIGWMTGGGTVPIDELTQAHAAGRLECLAGDGPNRLSVGWPGFRFHLESMDAAGCSDDPDIDPETPSAGFDTHAGTGTGRLNGITGATINWIIKDAGEPGTDDWISLEVLDELGDTVLEVEGNLRGGNFQAHGRD